MALLSISIASATEDVSLNSTVASDVVDLETSDLTDVSNTNESGNGLEEDFNIYESKSDVLGSVERNSSVQTVNDISENYDQLSSANQDILGETNSIYVNYDTGTDYIYTHGSSFDKPVKTIDYAVKQISEGGTIYLAGVTHNITSMVTIDKTVTIIGQKGTILTNYAQYKGVFSVSLGVNNVKIANCTFENNKQAPSSEANGDVILNKGNNLIVTNCTFINNTAKSGAAIYNEGEGCIVDNCSFIDNNVNGGGAAIYNSGNNFVVGNCSFVNNTSQASTLTDGSGGAIYNSGDNFVVGNCSFIDNNAALGGGAIGIYGAGGKNPYFIVDNCSFINNTVTQGSGGAISSYVALVINNCSFINNTVSENGGAVVSYGSGLKVNKSCFINNTAKYGTVYTSYISTVVNSSFINNTATKGVAVYNSYHYPIKYGEGLNLINNTYSGISGAKTYIYNGLVINTSVTITVLKNETFNIEPGKEVVLFANITTEDGASVSGQSLTFFVDGNTRVGSVENLDDGNYTLMYTPSEGKHVVSATYNYANNVKVKTGILDVPPIDTIYVDYVKGDDTKSGINWNTAVKTIEHAMTLVPANGKIRLADGIHNVTSLISVGVANITIIGNGSKTIITNYGNGKGVFNITANNITIYNCSFVNNSLANNGVGGAIMLNYTVTGFSVIGCTFINNTAYSGGAIASYAPQTGDSAGGVCTVSGCTFINNTASAAGAIAFQWCGGTVINSTFVNNSATNGAGGAIVSTRHSITVSNSSFVNNTAKGGGNAICHVDSSCTLNDNWWGNNTPNWSKLIASDGKGHTIDTYAVLSLTVKDNVAYVNFYRDGTNTVLPFSRNLTLTVGDQTPISSKTVDGTFNQSYVTPEGSYAITASVDNEKQVINFIKDVYVDPKGDDGNTGLSWDSPVKTIEHAMEIVLANGNIHLADGDYSLSDKVSIDKTINVIGNGTKTVLTGESGVFDITADNVAIYNSTFKDCLDSAISNSGSGLNVSNCNFIKNTASSGGAIYNTGSGLNVSNSSFVDNSADSGSAIYDSTGTLVANDNWWGNNTPNWATLVSDTFTPDSYAVLSLKADKENIAVDVYRNGTDTHLSFLHDFTLSIGEDSEAHNFNNGAFTTTYEAPEGEYNVTAVVDNQKSIVSFLKNVYVDYENGDDNDTGLNWTCAIRTIEHAMEIVLANGNIYLADGTHIVKSQLDIDKTVSIIGNGTKTIITTEGKDRVFNVKADDVAIYNSTFDNNKADNGGAIYNDAKNLKIENSIFTNNKATNGGAIYNTANGEKLSIINSTFISNNVTSRGGAIKNLAAGVSIIDSIFEDNIGVDDSGAIGNDGANLLINNSRFVNNTAKISGAIRNTGANLKIVDSNFTKNYVSGNDGAIGNDAINFIIIGSNFNENSASGTGGAITVAFRTDYDVSIINSTFVGNKADVGGAIYNPCCNLSVINSTFKSNTARDSGAIYTSKGLVTNSSFTANRATGDAGAIKIVGADVVVSNSNFTDNVASSTAGAIGINGHNAQILNSNFTGNVANIGAALRNWKVNNVKIMNCNFTKNKANGDDGAIGILGGQNLTIIGSNFTENSAAGNGGAITNAGGYFTILNSSFVNNKAKNGGAIRALGDSANSVINGSYFESNIANEYGGSIYNDAANLKIIDSKFIKNSANLWSGAIHNWAANLNVINSTFDGNKATNGAGAICIKKSGASILNSTFINNVALNEGGAGIWNEADDFKVENSTFTSNSACYGSAIYNSFNAKVINSTFTDNTATATGGTIYNTAANAKLLVENSTFGNNNAVKGVAVYNTNSAFLNLTNNNYSEINLGKTHIYNEGTLAQVNVTVLNKETVSVYYNQVITLFASVTSDGASVSGQTIDFTLNTTDEKYNASSNEEGTYSTSYTVKHVGNATVSAVYRYTNNAKINATTITNVDTGCLKSGKGYTDLNIVVEDISVGDIEIIKIYLNDDAEGNVTLTLNDTGKYNLTQLINKGKVEFAISGLAVGNYSVNVTYHGSSLYHNKTNDTFTFKVSKLDPDFRADVVNITYGDNATIIINLPINISGKDLVNLTINGTSKLIDIANGKGKLVLENLGVGTYDVIANFTGNDNYTNKTIKTGFKVNQYSAALYVVINNVTYGEISTITAILTGPNSLGLTGKVTVIIGDDEYYVDVNEGRGVLSKVKLPVNVYEFSAIWNENSAVNKNYTVSIDSGKFSVSRANIHVDVDALDVIYGDKTKINVNLSKKVNGDVVVKIDGEKLTSEFKVENGVGIFDIDTIFSVGNHTVEVSFGDANYNDSMGSCNFTVFKANPTLEVSVPSGDITFGDLTQNITFKVIGVTKGSVNITIDGKSYMTNVDIKVEKVAIPLLSPCKHNIAVVYNGNEEYNVVRDESKVINVVKATPTLNVNIGDVDYNNTFTIDVSLDNNLNGVVVVWVNGTSYAVNVTNGKGSASGIKLDAGQYSYNATWEGNVNYSGITKNKDLTFNVSPIKAQAIIISENIIFGDKETITVRLPYDASGKLAITVLDENSKDVYTNTTTLVNGIATYVIVNLNIGKYSVKLSYSDDKNYNEIKYDFNSFSVGRANSTLWVVVNDADYRQASKITAILNEKLSGSLLITIYDGKEIARDINGKVLKDVEVSVSEGIGHLNTIKLAAGKYTFDASWQSGESSYNASKTNGSFVVNQITPTIKVNGTPFIYGGEDETIAISLPDDVTGSVNVTFNGETKTYTLKEAKSITFEKLSVGNYTVKVTYLGDGNFTIASLDYDFEVLKITPELAITTNVIVYGDNETITVKLPTGVNGYVNVSVDGKYYDTINLKNAVGSVNVTNLSAGLHYFVFNYSGDVKYNGASAVCDINVSKANSTLDVNIENIYYNNTFKITATLNGVYSEKLTGIVVVSVDGKKYYVEVNDGVGYLDGIKLPADNYDFTATWSGNNNYNDTSYFGSFNVSKINATVDISTSNITFGENEIISVILPSDITGSVSIKVDNDSYDVNITNGVATKVLSGLNAGNHTVTVTYNGDNNYNKFINITKFNVANADCVLNVVIGNVYYGKSSIITALLTGVNNTGLNGNVIVIINGTKYTVGVVNGKGSVDVKLEKGTYNFTAYYNGTENYNKAEDSGSFVVSDITQGMYVNVDDIYIGENEIIIVTLPEDVTNNVTIKVNNQEYSVRVVDGMAIKVISELGVNHYVVEAYYPGDTKYEAMSAKGVFTVSKFTPTLNIESNNIVFGGEEIITINLPSDATGDVVITVDGKDYVANITNGGARVNISGLDAGKYNVTVKYSGDSRYAEDIKNTLFNVTKSKAVLNVNIDDVNYGEIFKITAKLNGVNNAQLNGIVSVKVDGKEYSVSIKDGVGYLDGVKLSACMYGFTAFWEGSNNYENVDVSGYFNVAKINPTLEVVANPVKVGQTAVITLNLPSDVSGNINVVVNNVIYNVEAKNGNVLISDLKAGNYTVFVDYEGDNNYNSLIDHVNLIVSKVSDYNASVVVPSEVKEGENTTIDVDLPSDATGNIVITVDGKEYVFEVVNGSANVTIPPLDAGEHNITTSYSGDDKYESVTKYDSFNVIKKDSFVVLSLDDVIMYYHDGTRLVAILVDTNGNPIANKTVLFTVNGLTYNRTTDSKGMASMALNLESGVYNVSASYNGSVLNATVTVKSSIIGCDIVKMFMNDTQFYATFIGANGNVLANTTVKFNINGVFYMRTTDNNGTARLNINLDPGNYTLTAYNPFNNEQKGFNVLVRSLIEISDLTKYYNNASKFEAKIWNKNGSVGANKTVTFNINGVFYTRTADENGIVKLPITLRPGDYVITSMYEGLSIGNKVKVLPTLETADLSMTYKDGSTFKVRTLDGEGNPLANENLTFNIHGVFYNKTTGDDGVANLNINLMKGEYIITSYWKDYEIGNKIEVL